MDDLINRFENKLGEAYSHTPELPGRVKMWLVKWLPWGTLLAAFASILAAALLWQIRHYADERLASGRSSHYHFHQPILLFHGFDVALLLSIILLFTDAALYLLAFPMLRSQKKAGWNTLFYISLLNIPYGASTALTSLGSISSLGSTVITTAIGLYVLFQLRSYYSA